MRAVAPAHGASKCPAVTMLRPAASTALERAEASSSVGAFDPFVTLRTWRLRRQLYRWSFPSVVSVRFGGAKGLDELSRELLAQQYLIEMGTALPADIALTNLAAARAEILPRALARWDSQRLFEQHVIAPMHRLLACGNYDVCRWVRTHHRSFWARIRRLLSRVLFRRAAEMSDPVDRFRTSPGAFASFVWARLWALPELEEVLESAMPGSEPPPPDEHLDSDPVTTAVQVVTKLDTDHAGWVDPDRLLRELHAQVRAANILAPQHPLVTHIFQRVLAAVGRFADFERAYQLGTKREPLPEWVQAALDAFDVSEVRRHGPDQMTKFVRRNSCRLWVTGSYSVPLAEVATVPVTQSAATMPNRVPPEDGPRRAVGDDLDVGF